MFWMKGGVLALSLALNVYLVMRPGTGEANVARSMEVQGTVWSYPTAAPSGGEVDKEPKVQSPLLEGWLRLSRPEWMRLGEQCFLKDEWALSELAVEAFGLTAGQASVTNQALDRMRQRVFLWEAERVEKHSDWHYTLGALTEEEINDLKSTFQETLKGSVDSAQTEALTELAFAHEYFFKDGFGLNLDIQMMPYRNHLEIQFGSPQSRAEIPFEGTPGWESGRFGGTGAGAFHLRQGNRFHSDGSLVLVGHSKRISHLIDLEAMWHRAFEETESLRKPSEP